VAEEKYAAIKRLIPFLHHAIDEYHSHSQPLGDHLAGGFEKSLFTLVKMIGSLEAYLALQAPTAPSMPSASETTGATAATSSASSAAGSPSTESQSSNGNNGEAAPSPTTGTVETPAPAGEPVVSGRAS
jgi:hypothetical protein